MSVTFNNFTTQTASIDSSSIMDTLANTFNGQRMGNSALIGAVGGAFNNVRGAGALTVLAGGLNGYLTSDSDNVFGKVFDAAKGMLEAYAIKKVVEMLPPQLQTFGAMAIGALGKYAGNSLANLQENNNLLIQQELANSPSVQMMLGSNRGDLLEAAKASSEKSYNYVEDKSLRNHFKMT